MDQNSQKQPEATKQLEVIKQCHDDKCMTINGRDYQLTAFRHDIRRKVFAFTSSIQVALKTGDMSFLDTARYLEIEKMISERVTFEGMQLSKLPEHWEEYPEDYLLFATTALQVVAYPFMPAVAGS